MKRLLFLLFLPLAFISCEKDEGPMGPEGPQGPKGEQGEQGPAGTANTETEVFTIQSGDWLEYGTVGNDDHRLEASVFPNELTTSVTDSGAVHVYMDIDQQGKWFTMPFSFPYNGETFSFYYAYESFYLTFIVESSGNNAAMNGASDFKVFMVEPSAMKLNPEKDLADPQVVKEELVLD